MSEGQGVLPGLTAQERETLKKMFSSPLDIPTEFRAWLVSYLEANPPMLPIGQIFGAKVGRVTLDEFLAMSPFDGQTVTIVDVDGGTKEWTLRYDESSSGTYRWKFLYGDAVSSEVAAQENTGSTVYTDLTTVGPSVTAPFAGLYLVTISRGATSALSGGTSVDTHMSTKVGSEIASDSFSVQRWGGGSYTRSIEAARGDIIKAVYRTESGGFPAEFAKRTLTLVPFRLSQ